MEVRAQFESHVLALLRQRPAVNVQAARQLELLCQRQLDAETIPGWRTFWSLATHFFEGLRLAPNRSIEEPEASAASQVLSGLQLREQFNDHDKPVDDSLQVINHLLFLEQADVISQRLVNILNDWSESPESDLPTEAQLDVQSMAQLAEDVQLTAVQQVADSLGVQLARLRAVAQVGPPEGVGLRERVRREDTVLPRSADAQLVRDRDAVRRGIPPEVDVRAVVVVEAEVEERARQAARVAQVGVEAGIDLGHARVHVETGQLVGQRAATAEELRHRFDEVMGRLHVQATVAV